MTFQKGIREGVLAVAEGLYRLGLAGVGWLYARGILRTHRLPALVVSVGNLTWGGTGKTPLVLYLARALERRGWRVAVLTRGYGRDEARLLKERLDPIPVLAHPDRVASGIRAVQEMGANLLLLDDGYQQWRVKKDLEILTASARSPLGNGRLIPRGTLREPARAAARADLIVLKKGDATRTDWERGEQELRRLNGSAPVFRMGYGMESLWRWPGKQPVPWAKLQGQRVCVLAGIADPSSFEAMVEGLGTRIALRHPVPDHHPYTAGELAGLLARCEQSGIRAIVTTAKDAVRIPWALLEEAGPNLKGMDLLVLEIHPTFEPNEGEFLHRIDSLLARARG